MAKEQQLRPGPSRNQRLGGVTLIELLVTISVAIILMGVGVAAYRGMNRGYAVLAATSSIEAVLRSARAGAIHEHEPAVVVVEAQRDNPKLVGSLYALGRQTVSCWHFEPSQFAGSKIKGALGQEGTVPPGATPAPGKVGTALLLNGSSICVEVSSPYLDGLREGVFVECDVFPDATGPTGLEWNAGDELPIVTKDGSFRVWLAYGDSAFALVEQVETDSGGAQQGQYRTEFVIRPGEWTRVAMAYCRDGQAESGANKGLLTLRVNGEEAVRQTIGPASPGSMLLIANTNPLQIGTNGTRYFRGRIDELKIGGLLAGERHRLEKNVDVTVDAGGSRDGRVHFDAEGKLDRTCHSRPVLFRVASQEDALLRVVRVNWVGCVEVFDHEPPPQQ